MKKIKSYTGIWTVEKVIYAINDMQLPIPVTFTQITWFVLTMFFVIIFSGIPPLSLVDSTLSKYMGIPITITWLMSKKSFDGKKPISFLKSVISYHVKSKVTFGNKPVTLNKIRYSESYTAVRSDIIEISN